ncbi:MAG: HAMP domain-containing histidine kinase [Clostridia bacterium]|nr:HAMP domain-containing histidine kinase [Clostridia bacterium]
MKIKIKTRLIISNILMLGLPVVLITFISIGVFSAFMDIYSSRIEQLESLVLSGSYSEDDIIVQHLETELNDLLLKCMLLVGIIAIAIIALVDLVLTKHMLRRIIVPLDLLRFGANQIKEENLDFEMRYDGQDEFSQVCSDFDRMRLRLKASIEMQSRYEENRKELLAGISHDLRTPLTTIKGYVEGLLDGIASTPEKQEHYLRTIKTKAIEMDSLVDSLFLFSKLDMGKFPFSFESVSVRKYLDDYFVQAADEMIDRNLFIVNHNDIPEDVFAEIDIEQFSRVLSNILSNSLKYSVAETCNVHVESYFDAEKELAVIVIGDDGPGVAEEYLDKLFESFFRGDPARTRPSEGSGLGLAITHRIITAHKGTIIPRNNSGLEYCISIPAAEKTISDEILH